MQVFLRVLYTVNSNPQYILAKSSSQIPVIPCEEHSTSNEPAYARVPLKACLTAVCDSSPDLLQDPTRDFSLYFLDPLETQPLPTGLAHAPHNTASPRGVAVALGLISWALESDNSANVFVTGTMISNTSPALEVVCALRETKRIPKPIFHSYPSYGPMSAPGPSQFINPHLLQPAGAGWYFTSHLQQDQQQRTLTRSADFPELYIGPPRRARGRPVGLTSSKSKSKAKVNVPPLPAMSSSELIEPHSESKQDIGKRFKQKTKRPSGAPPTHSPFICTPLTRNTVTEMLAGTPVVNERSLPSVQNQVLSHTGSYLQAQPQPPLTHPLLGLLSAISSTPSGNMAAHTPPEQQAALLSALQGLLTTNPHLLRFTSTNSPPTISIANGLHGGNHAGDKQDDDDSDIIILDSSTVDTTMFRKPSTRQGVTSSQDVSPFTTCQESPMPDTVSSPLPASMSFSGQENTSTVTADGEKPASKAISSGLVEGGGESTSHSSDLPATPTLSRTRKRKLDVYSQSQVSPTPTQSSPSVTRPGKALTVKHRVQDFPRCENKLVSSPSKRLPSMLGAMCARATKKSHLQVGATGPLIHEHLVTVNPDKNENQTATSSTRPSYSKAGINDGIALDAISLKRRRTLTEFMPEHEALKKAKARKHSSSGRMLDTNSSQAALPRSANAGSTLRHAQSSPSRPLFRSDSMISALLPPPSTSQFSFTTMTSAAFGFTDPVASTSTTTETKNPLKNFVLPAWARTSTAMLPRLSEEALARQRAEQVAKKAQASLRRRETAKAKRKRHHGAICPSRESSDDDDEVIASAKPRTLHPSSSVARSSALPLAPFPCLPIIASDAVEPIPSSPPRLHHHPPLPVVPSTPPRKSLSLLGSATHRTPSKSGSCSPFAPSCQDPASLFTPSTPCVTRSLSRIAYTPHSPTGVHRSGGTRKSPRKSVLQTPRRNSGDRHTPRSVHSARVLSYASPSVATYTPQTGMATRAFLLPPPSPCALRTPRRSGQVHSRISGGLIPNDSGMQLQGSVSDTEYVEQDKGCKEDIVCRELDEVLLEGLAPVQCSSQGGGRRELHDITSSSDANLAEDDYASSPLPPSSPLPASTFSSPAKHSDGSSDAETINNTAIPDSDILLPSASDSDGPQSMADTTWLSGTAGTWFTDSETSAWLTEAEAWLTDTEGGGGPVLTDSDGTGAWLSDSDAIFGDMSSFASNWLSDDADVDTDDGELGTIRGQGQVGGFDPAAFQEAYVAVVERSGQNVGKDDSLCNGNGPATPTMTASNFESFWESIQPLLGGGGGALNDSSTVPGLEVAQDIQALLDDLVGT